MNRKQANKKSVEGTISIGDLRAMIETRRLKGGMSRVNPAFDIDAICNIYKAALEGRDDSETPVGTRYDIYKRRDVPGKDSLIIRNILRDCA